MKDHRCPGPKCPVRVPNARLACPRHWAQLSKPVQDAVYATRSRMLLDPERREALAAAREEWGTP